MPKDITFCNCTGIPHSCLSVQWARLCFSMIHIGYRLPILVTGFQMHEQVNMQCKWVCM